MFDFHMHTKVSIDSEAEPRDMIRAAEAAGLSEICFTDHYDFNKVARPEEIRFDIKDYNEIYEGLSSDTVKLRYGFEFGFARWNMGEVKKLTDQRNFDFVIGSLHFVDETDPYSPTYWVNRSLHKAFEDYLIELYECVKLHDDFDVLGHLNYVCKSPCNASKLPLLYRDFSDISDEIMKVLISKGKGMEINTSGVDRSGDFLPSEPFFRRFRELGGEIVTVGSDAHVPERVGLYVPRALDLLRDVFGYVCTFEGRKPIFHKL